MNICKGKQFHSFDPENVGLCPGCKTVHFFCSVCDEEIETRRLRDCPKETRVLALQLKDALMEKQGA